MPPASPPKAVAVEVVAAQPTDADRAAIAHLSARDRKSVAPVTYLVKVRFETMPEATSQGWALYIGDFRVPKYWATQDGIYFKVFDPQFFEEHQGEPLRFSQNAPTCLKVSSSFLASAAAAAPSLAARFFWRLPLVGPMIFM